MGLELLLAGRGGCVPLCRLREWHGHTQPGEAAAAMRCAGGCRLQPRRLRVREPGSWACGRSTAVRGPGCKGCQRRGKRRSRACTAGDHSRPRLGAGAWQRCIRRLLGSVSRVWRLEFRVWVHTAGDRSRPRLAAGVWRRCTCGQQPLGSHAVHPAAGQGGKCGDSAGAVQRPGPGSLHAAGLRPCHGSPGGPAVF